MRIRRAAVTDAAAIAQVAEQSFRETFADSNTADDMDAYCSRAFAVETLQDELSVPANTFVLAFDDDPVGYTKLREGVPLEAVGPRGLELERIYVVRSHLGRGIGAALMDDAVERARSAGHDTLWLGVWEHNERALAFYARQGFQDVGRKDFLLGDDLQTDRVLRRRL